MSRPLVTVTTLALVACGSGNGNSKASNQGTKMAATRIVPNAAGATRLILSPNGQHAVAELRGAWVHEEFGEGDHVPGLLKLFDGNRALVKTAMGWPLGGPDDDGTLIYLEEAPHEYEYRITSSASAAGEGTVLALPEGYWHVKAAIGDPAGGCAVVVLWSPVSGHDWKDPSARMDRLWLASIDRATLKVRATRALELTTPIPGRGRYQRGVAAGGDAVALIEVPAPGATDLAWRVHALSCDTLDTRWTTELDTREPAPAPPARSAGKRTETVTPATASAADERSLRGADLAFSGDGKQIAMIYGQAGRSAISSPRLFVLDATTGTLAGTLAERITHDVDQIVPVLGRAEVALLHRTSFRSGGGAAHKHRFYGVTIADLAQRSATLAVDAARLEVDGWRDADSILATAVAAWGDTIELVPDGYGWVRNHAESVDDQWPEDAVQTGARRPEVAGWITLPMEWHRPARARAGARRLDGVDSIERPSGLPDRAKSCSCKQRKARRGR